MKPEPLGDSTLLDQALESRTVSKTGIAQDIEDDRWAPRPLYQSATQVNEHRVVSAIEADDSLYSDFREILRTSDGRDVQVPVERRQVAVDRLILLEELVVVVV